MRNRIKLNPDRFTIINKRVAAMNWKQSIVIFFATIAFLFAGNAITGADSKLFAQTDININNTNLFRLGGSVTVAENQVVENAHAIGGSVIIQPNARVTQSASAICGNVVLKSGARIDGGLGVLITWKLGKAQPPVLG